MPFAIRPSHRPDDFRCANEDGDELKNTRDQISQIQKQLGAVELAGQQMSQTAQTLEGILGRREIALVPLGKSLWSDCWKIPFRHPQYEMQYRFSSGEAADAVVKLSR